MAKQRARISFRLFKPTHSTKVQQGVILPFLAPCAPYQDISHGVYSVISWYTFTSWCSIEVKPVDQAQGRLDVLYSRAGPNTRAHQCTSQNSCPFRALHNNLHKRLGRVRPHITCVFSSIAHKHIVHIIIPMWSNKKGSFQVNIQGPKIGIHH